MTGVLSPVLPSLISEQEKGGERRDAFVLAQSQHIPSRYGLGFL